MDQLVLDELPDDAGHLVAVEIDDRIGDLDLRHGKNASFNSWVMAGRAPRLRDFAYSKAIRAVQTDGSARRRLLPVAIGNKKAMPHCP